MKIATKAIAGAAMLYGVPLDEDQIMAYLSVLGQSGASEERLAAGVAAACQVCEFMPKPVDILKHMPSHAQKALASVDDDYIPPEDIEFNKAAFPLLNEYLAKKITRHEFLARLRWEAKKAGVERKIAWQDFGDDTPWNPRSMEAKAS
jgi:hypothetical protein